MEKNDAQYRAYKELKKNLNESNDYKAERSKVANANANQDLLKTTKYVCFINKDWIEAIENTIEFIEKAIAEERQFITTNGEVVPIEKVKKVNRNSVEHLARHADLITHVPDDKKDDLVPDKIYMVEKLADYAVYENKFLYMMLVYLEQFIYLRIDKISKLRRTYLSEFKINKVVKSDKRQFKVETKIVDNRYDNIYPIVDLEADQLFERASNCLEIVTNFLNSPLMQEVSKSPMIKPPVVKTNVLKMNNNFKKCLALYDYIASYKGDGFKVKEINVTLAPFSEDLASEIADTINMTAFTAFKWGNNINDKLERIYQKEEQRRLALIKKKKEERLLFLKKKAKEDEQSLEELVLALDEKNKELINDSEALVRARAEIEKLEDKIEELNNEINTHKIRIDELEKLIEAKEKEINDLRESYEGKIKKLKLDQEYELLELQMDYIQEEGYLNECEAEINKYQNEIIQEKIQIEIDKFKEEKEAELNEILEEKQNEFEEELQEKEDELDEVNSQNEELTEQLASQEENYNSEIENLNDQLNETTEQKDNLISQYNDLSKRYDALEEESLVNKARVRSQDIDKGKVVPEQKYTSRDEFMVLEKEFNAFERFMKTQWKMTKKEIRKENLWVKETKDPKKEKKKKEKVEKEPIEENKEENNS